MAASLSLHCTLLLIAVYVCVRPMVTPVLTSSASTIGSSMATQENASVTAAVGAYPLFGKHDPNRTYNTDEKKYLQVGVVDFERVKTPFIIGSWILAASLAKIGFHMFPKLSRMFPESCLLIVVGVLVGTVLYFGGLGDVEAAHHLDPDTFFLFMLPPIILDAGYFMPSRLFFDNLGTILVFAVIGTVFNTFTIGVALYFVGMTGVYGAGIPLLNMLVFASLISAVDPVAVLAVFEEIHVNQLLYIIVFGESLLNDAVTVVLYHMFEAYVEMGEGNITTLDVAAGLLKFLLVALGGVFVGVMWGLLTAFVTRFTSRVRVIEPLFIFVMAYLAYLNAEIFHLSGILSITFCGLTMKNYVITNVSAKSHTTIKYTMKMIASSSETVIFMLLGVATVHNHHHWNTVFVICTIVFCTVFRAIGVLILSAVVNRFRLDKIVNVDKFVMAYGGLRGAVAFALVLLIDPHHVPQQQMFLTTTIAVVYFTVFVQGISVGPLVEKLGVKKSSKREITMNERIHERSLDHIMAGVEDIVGYPGRHYVRNMLKHINHTYLRPWLIHEDASRDPKIMETFSRLALKDAMKTAVDDVINGPAGRQARLAVSGSPSVGGVSGGGEPRTSLNNENGSLSTLQHSQSWQHVRVSELAPGRSSLNDLSDAVIQHMLRNSLCNPRQRRWSYSRHAVRDEDIHTQTSQHQMPLFERTRIINMHRKRKVRNANRLISHPIAEGVPAISNSTTTSSDGVDNAGVELNFQSRPPNNNHVQAEDDSQHITEVESVLPWKRNDEVDVCQRPLKWHNTSAPAWISNDHYSCFVSPPTSLTADVSAIEEKRPSVRSSTQGRGSLTSSLIGGLNHLRQSLRRNVTGQCDSSSGPPPAGGGGGGDCKLSEVGGRLKSGLDVCADIEGGYVNFAVVRDEDVDSNVQYRTRV